MYSVLNDNLSVSKNLWQGVIPGLGNKDLLEEYLVIEDAFFDAVQRCVANLPLPMLRLYYGQLNR